MENKLTEEHHAVLKEAVYPMKFYKNKEGLKKTILVRDALDIIRRMTIKSDCQVAADLQQLIQIKVSGHWVSKGGDVYKWTDKGFEYLDSMSVEQAEAARKHFNVQS
jgi:hypothetical protein